MIMKCIAIDDEQLALNKIIRYGAKLDYVEIRATFTNALEALSFIKKHKVDLIFLDIQMEEFSGIDLLEAMQQMPYVIITSAFDAYAIKSYEYNVVDYLLKPIQFPRFVKAVEKVYASFGSDLRLEEAAKDHKKDPPHSILIKSGREVIRIPSNEILYIEGMKDYLALVLKTRKILTLMGFNAILKELPKQMFCRVHKSYIVNLSAIDKADTKFLTVDGKEIPVSNSYRIVFKENFNRYRAMHSK